MNNVFAIVLRGRFPLCGSNRVGTIFCWLGLLPVRLVRQMRWTTWIELARSCVISAELVRSARTVNRKRPLTEAFNKDPNLHIVPFSICCYNEHSLFTKNRNGQGKIPIMKDKNFSRFNYQITMLLQLEIYTWYIYNVNFTEIRMFIW